MKQYIAFFRIRFINFLQYKTAAWAAVGTQFIWGTLELIVFSVFYDEGIGIFPMDFQALVDYIWLKQAFLSFFALWVLDSDILESIRDGSVAYELCRPINLYEMWFSKCSASRLSKCSLRAIPILLVAMLIPGRFRMSLPADWQLFGLFIISMAAALIIISACCMLIYAITFYLLAPNGITLVISSVADFLSGAVIPLMFFPEPLRRIAELLPFASMQDLPLRIYGGELAYMEAIHVILLQLFWEIALIALGKWLLKQVLKRVVVQGG